LTQKITEIPPVMQQIGMLNLRINDMLTQLNIVMKAMIDENNTLKKENTELRAKQEKT
jgi:regulator of replication initiation timing